MVIPSSDQCLKFFQQCDCLEVVNLRGKESWSSHWYRKRTQIGYSFVQTPPSSSYSVFFLQNEDYYLARAFYIQLFSLNLIFIAFLAQIGIGNLIRSHYYLSGQFIFLFSFYFLHNVRILIFSGVSWMKFKLIISSCNQIVSSIKRIVFSGWHFYILSNHHRC